MKLNGSHDVMSALDSFRATDFSFSQEVEKTSQTNVHEAFFDKNLKFQHFFTTIRNNNLLSLSKFTTLSVIISSHLYQIKQIFKMKFVIAAALLTASASAFTTSSPRFGGNAVAVAPAVSRS
jgi:hypothetical protein